MDIREIEAICAVTHYKNYSEAAYRISSSPSVISKQIARAEEELGLRIFERATKSAPVRLTKEGAELIGYLQEIMENYRLLRDKVAAFKVAGSRSVTVGLHRFLGHFHGPDPGSDGGPRGHRLFPVDGGSGPDRQRL